MFSEPVKTWMTCNPITIYHTATLAAARNIMRENNIRRLLVVDKGKLIGILTLGDIREAGPSNATTLSIYELNYLLAEITVKNCMTRNPITISPEESVSEAARIMLDNKISGLPVMKNGELVGIFTESDIFRVIVAKST